MQKDVKGLAATFKVSCDGNAGGNVSVKWQRGQPRRNSASTAIFPRAYDWVGGGFDSAMRSSVFAYIPPEMPYPCYALKTPDGFLVDSSADPTVQARLFAFSADYVHARRSELQRTERS